MTSTRSSKKGKRGNKKVTHQEDRLSNLPNEILVKILSCLKTRDAVRSGILSTRWKSVWTSVPVLDLNQYDFNFKGKRSDGDHKREEARFLIFMDQVLIAHKMPCLEKVRISGGTCDPYLLRSWMRAALERNANELDVEFYDLPIDTPCKLTHKLFSHNKLVILKLYIVITLNFLANSSVFPNLKVLQLHRIIYRDDDSLPNLLSSCPMLEDLVIIRGRDDNLGTLNLVTRSVKRLKVDNRSGIYGKHGVVHKMVFDAPAVESLDIYCTRTQEFLVKDLSRIVDAKFEIYNLRSFSYTYKLLREVSNVKFLRLDHCTVEALVRSSAYDNPMFVPYDFPMFYNLTRLEIYGDERCDTTLEERGVEGDIPTDEQAKALIWELLLQILTCSPMLEHLKYEVFDNSCEGYGKASDWDVPDCLVSSLKTVEFNCFSDSDVERVRYFLLNARVLEEMRIRPTCGNSGGSKPELFNAIFENKKGFVTVTWSEEKDCDISPLVADLIRDVSAR